MRERYGYCGPYRLGLAVGGAGVKLPPPPYYTKRARKQYQQGIVWAETEARLSAIAAAVEEEGL
jgi:hypothetical protein